MTISQPRLLTCILTSRTWPNVVRILVLVVLAIHVGLLFNSASTLTPTGNEPAHLAAGVSYWKFGKFDLYRVNPPLTRIIAAAPVVITGCETNWKRWDRTAVRRPEFAVGIDFIRANDTKSATLFQLARWALIPISVLGAVSAFLFARNLYSSELSGLIALALWCFSPNVLTHATLITPDCAAAAIGLFSLYRFWVWLTRGLRSKSACVWAGTALGLALISKTSWLILLAIYPTLWFATLWCYSMTRSSVVKSTLQFLVILTIALLIVNATYLFDGSCMMLKNYQFKSTTIGAFFGNSNSSQHKKSVIGSLRVPFPREYVLGIDEQICDFEFFIDPSFLGGEWAPHGWWYYYLYAFAVKTPHGTQGLLLVSCFTLMPLLRVKDKSLSAKDVRDASIPTGATFSKTNNQDSGRMAAPVSCLDREFGELVLLAPALGIFAMASSQTEFSHHYRYVLPTIVSLFVFCGRAGMLIESPAYSAKVRITGLLTVTLLFFSMIYSVLREYPNEIAYFNELSGGVRNGDRHLAHSSLDWGQLSLTGLRELNEPVLLLRELNVLTPMLSWSVQQGAGSNDAKVWILSRTTASRIRSARFNQTDDDEYLRQQIEANGVFDKRIPTAVLIYPKPL